MIFYFSGTGNSKHVAYSLAKDEQVINMAEAMDHLDFQYTLKEGEKLGFVFPVYCYTINDLVVDFIYHLNVQNVSYTYSIVTRGGNTGHLDGYLKKLLKERSITLDYFAQLEMPDDTVLYYNIEDDEYNRKKLIEADQKLEGLKKEINEQKHTQIGGGNSSEMMRQVYHRMLSTRRFHVTNECISCGLCERICPVHAIELKEGHPVWVKPKCLKCTACINNCPKAAIQYGQGTKSRHRYHHPDINKYN